MVSDPTTENSNNRRIAKNALFLYVRMFLVMLVTLYTSRAVLKCLGVEDYGVYQSVGGIVGMLSFLNGALSSGSARFITYELGRNDYDRLRNTFCTTLNVHIIIAFTVAFLAETIGMWMLYHKLTIPDGRMGAAFWVLQFSVITCLFSLTQIPYNASIVAHERMNVYAYMSILEVVLKLGIVLLLTLSRRDRLIVYALLMCAVQCLILLLYRFYCVRHFSETRFRFIFDKSIFKDVLGFSAWSVVNQLSTALNSQGSTVITNMFFGPGVVTARAVTIQVNMAANQFVDNFRTAVSPQIVKRYAAGDIVGSRQLLLGFTKYSYYLMFLICLPIFFLSEPLLHLWLGQVPPYSSIFLRLIVIQTLFNVFNTSFYRALYTMGRQKEDSLICSALGIICFVIVYLLFRAGASPLALSWVNLIYYALLGLVVKPILIHNIAGYPYGEIFATVRPCVIITAGSSVVVCFLDALIKRHFGNLPHFLLTVFVSIAVSGTAIYFLGLTKMMRQELIKAVCSRLGSRGHLRSNLSAD